MKLPTITRAEIQGLADSLVIYQRGVDYFQSGRVTPVDFVHNCLTAEVLGNQAIYRVEIVWGEKRIVRASCNCPYEGYICKHIVAVLLMLCEDAPTITKAVGLRESSQRSLASLLSGLSKDQLLEIILGVARQHPEITVKLLSLAEERGAADSPQAASDLAGEQASCLWTELEIIVSDFDRYGGGPEDMENQAYDLFYELEEILKKKPVPSDDRGMIIEECCKYLQSGNSGFNDSLLGLCFAAANEPAHWQQIIAGLEPLARQRDSGYYRNVINRIYLEELGDEETYLRQRRESLVYGKDYLELAQFWRGKGKVAKAIEVAERGMKDGKGTVTELRWFLIDEYRKAGRREDAFELELQAFEESPTLNQYKKIKKESGKETWPSVERRLVKALDTKRWKGAEIMKIRLFRKEYQPILEYLRHQAESWHSWGWTSADDWLAKETAKHHPAEITEVYQTLIQRSIMGGNRKAYRLAAHYAKMLKELMGQTPGGLKEWQKFIDSIRRTNPRRRALLEEFSNL